MDTHRVLVLDKNPSSRMLIEYALAMGRVDFESVETSAQILEKWQVGICDFVFIAFDMLDMSGCRLVRHFRKQDPNVALIILSVSDEPPAVADAIAAGCDLYLVKPFQMDLVMTLVKILDSEKLRSNPSALVIDDLLRPRWERRAATF